MGPDSTNLTTLSTGVTGQEYSRARSSRLWGITNHGDNNTPRDQSSWRVSSANFPPPRVIFRTRIMRRLGCKLFIISRLICYMSLKCPNQWIILLNNRVLCYKNTNINLTITRLGCSYKQFHVAPSGEWYSI